ncbi:hypothetical protein RvY_01840-2 [Ramazzottius varieornatus]|uniref:Uncharacterized protein n=1 Tax=Ramazzottius varieornatus TaxID=947166 RepID=A0A1D1USE0_RAMVA|nr:hypothetical protein RvY_01840-2 [Ramazzottius varieornatus]
MKKKAKQEQKSKSIAQEQADKQNGREVLTRQHPNNASGPAFVESLSIESSEDKLLKNTEETSENEPNEHTMLLENSGVSCERSSYETSTSAKNTGNVIGDLEEQTPQEQVSSAMKYLYYVNKRKLNEKKAEKYRQKEKAHPCYVPPPKRQKRVTTSG